MVVYGNIIWGKESYSMCDNKRDNQSTGSAENTWSAENTESTGSA